jgi:hypothetical protein
VGLCRGPGRAPHALDTGRTGRTWLGGDRGPWAFRLTRGPVGAGADAWNRSGHHGVSVEVADRGRSMQADTILLRCSMLVATGFLVIYGARTRPRRPRPRRSGRCHRVSVSERTRKLLHRSRESSRAAAAKERPVGARESRSRPSPARTLSWRRRTAVKSRLSTPQRTSRQSSPHKSRHRKDQSTWAVWLRAGVPSNGLVRAPSSLFTPTGSATWIEIPPRLRSQCCPPCIMDQQDSGLR